MVAPEMAEKHNRRSRPGKITWEDFKDSYRTDARWIKAIQHRRDNGLLSNDNSDIGPLIVEIKRDIREEDYEIIMDFLWRNFGKKLLVEAVHGFPEFYKKLLDGGDNDQQET
jgi:hypothetical protein